MEFSRLLLLLLPLALEGNSMHGILPAAAAAHRSQCGNSKKVPKSFAKN
jgi:hypothetical protein